MGPGLSLLCFRLWFWVQECSSRNDTVVSATSSAQLLLRDFRQSSAASWRGLRLCVSARVSVERPSPLGRALAHRIRVIDGCVVWVRWAPHWYLGWYVGPGLSLRCFRLWFGFRDCSSLNDTVVSATSSVQRLLRDFRQWSSAPW